MPLLCLVPLIFMGLATGPACLPATPWLPGLPSTPRTLAIQRVVGIPVTSPLAAESGPWEERRHPQPCLLSVLPDPFFTPPCLDSSGSWGLKPNMPLPTCSPGCLAPFWVWAPTPTVSCP